MSKWLLASFALFSLVLTQVATAAEPPEGVQGWRARATYICSTIDSNNELTIKLVANYKDWQDDSAPPSRTVTRRLVVHGAGDGGRKGCQAQAETFANRRDVTQITELGVCYFESGVTFLGLLNLTPNGDIVVVSDRYDIFRGDRSERFQACLAAAAKINN